MATKEAVKNSKAKPRAMSSSADASEKKKRLTFDIPASLHAKLKITAVKRDETMGEIVLRMLEEYLK